MSILTQQATEQHIQPRLLEHDSHTDCAQGLWATLTGTKMVPTS